MMKIITKLLVNIIQKLLFEGLEQAGLGRWRPLLPSEGDDLAVRRVAQRTESHLAQQDTRRGMNSSKFAPLQPQG
jgi:hypothetical protein